MDRVIGTGRVRRLRARRARLGAGSILIVAGLVMVGSFVYQVWGTGVTTAHAQAGFRAQIAAEGFPVRPLIGGVAGFIQIPRIHLDMAFVQGAGAKALGQGPGHYASTPMPGHGGNVAIAGHRTTHLHPFWSLDDLRRGDRVVLQTHVGLFVYRVRWVRVVAPDDWSVIVPTPVPSLTLTTCTPRFTSRQRLVVRAVEIVGPDLARGSSG